MEDHLDSSISPSHHTVPSLDTNTMRLSIPPPPDLKPTIIQMQASNSINGPDDYQNQGMANGLSFPQPQKRRRRRSSTSLASITPSELAQRQKEHKTAHSNIEKKRRIKMNREFEALKFLIPAIRNNLIGANGETSGTLSNGEQLYKLTILQSSVDYIRYLHKVILSQDQALKELTGHAENGEFAGLDDVLSFANVDINTESYRSNLEAEFDFKKIFESFKIMQSPMLRANSNNRMSNTSPSLRASFDSYHHLPPPMSAIAGQVSFNNSNSNNRIRTGSLPNPSLSVAVSGLNSNASSTKTTPLLSAVPSPLISPTLQGKLPSSSSLNSNINNFQFQFPLMSKSSLSNGSAGATNTTNSASSSALSYSSNLTPVLSSMTNGNVNDYQNELNNNKESNMINSVSFELPSSALPPITLPTSSIVSFSTNTNSTYTASSSSSLNRNRSARVPSSVLNGVHSSSTSNSNGSSSRSSTSSNESNSGIGFQQGIPVNIGTALNDNRASSRSPSNVGAVVNVSGSGVTSNTGSLRSLLN